eukprot:355627-Chlamydomonas_euryale.AAC.25
MTWRQIPVHNPLSGTMPSVQAQRTACSPGTLLQKLQPRGSNRLAGSLHTQQGAMLRSAQHQSPTCMYAPPVALLQPHLVHCCSRTWCIATAAPGAPRRGCCAAPPQTRSCHAASAPRCTLQQPCLDSARAQRRCRAASATAAAARGCALASRLWWWWWWWGAGEMLQQ